MTTKQGDSKMATNKYFWDCPACGAENSRQDGECQFCECGGETCERDGCSDPRHPGLGGDES